MDVDVRYVLVGLREGERGPGVLQAARDYPDKGILGMVDGQPVVVEPGVLALINRLSEEQLRVIAPLLDAALEQPRVLEVVGNLSAAQWVALMNLADAFLPKTPKG